MKIKQLLKSKGRSFLMQTLCVVVSGMMVSSFNAQTTVTVGTGTGINSFTPAYGYYEYSYSQSIYTVADMAAVGITGPTIITKIAYHLISGDGVNSDNWTVYIGNTSKSSFASNSDWEVIGNLQNSYTGIVTFPTAGSWLTITLDTPYNWDGVSNLVIGVDENAAGYSFGYASWEKSDLGANRSIYYYNDYTNPDPTSPPLASNRIGSVPNIQFEVAPAPDCAGAPATSNIVSNLGAAFCEGDEFELTTDGSYFLNGITYQWQEFNGIGYDDILNDTNIVSNLTALTSTNYQLVVGCSITGDETILTPFAVTVNAAPTVAVDITETSICSGDAATITASGATTYAWSPATGLSNSNTGVVDASPTATTTYTVTGTDGNGCKNTATSVIIPNGNVTADVVINPSEVCTPGSAVSATIGGSLPVNSTGGVWNYRFLEPDGVTEAQTWSTNDVFNFIPTADSVYTFYYQLNNTACTENIDSVAFQFIVGFGGDVTTVDYDCINMGGTINVSSAFGQSNFTQVYFNDFSAAADMSAVTLTGSAINAGDMAVVTPSALSQSGNIQIANAGNIFGTNNAFNVTFNMSIDQPITNFGLSGADGMTYSFGDDATPTGNGNSVNGRGTKLRLGFDSAGNNNGNVPGIYLVYGMTSSLEIAPGNASTLAYSNNTALWHNQTNVPVALSINASGMATVSVGGVTIFENVQLPASYLTENVDSWMHLFSAGTGGAANRHAFDNFEISTGSLFYGLSQGASTTVPTVWQNSQSFTGLAPGTYNVWLAKDETAACGKNIQTVEIINTDPVVSLGNDTTICEGSTLVLDAENVGSSYVWSNNPATTQTIDVTTAGSYAAYVTAANGCTALGTIYVDVIDAPTATGITMQGNWQSYSFNVENPMNGVTYDWNFGDGTTMMNASASVSHVYWTEGSFDVTVTISNDCGSTDVTDQFTVANVAGINSIELEGLSIYPNPTSSELTISLDDVSESLVTVSSVTGAVVINNISFNGLTKLNVENWETGVYFIKVTNQGVSTTERIIVQ